MRFTLALLIATLAGCSSPADIATPATATTRATPTATATARPSPTPDEVATLIAAGDIASCEEDGDSATAALVAKLDTSATVAALGDLAYPAGSEQTYAECYDPVWGGWKDRTRPAMGNHDAQDDGGAAYAAYFGDSAGRPLEGWYSYDLGAWHVVVLNSNCGLVGCGEGSAQLEWLTNDLAENSADCTIAYWHHPRYSSGPHGDDEDVSPLWDALVEADADLLLVGHDHLYERFAPTNGLRQFTVGTGGKALYAAERVAPGSEVIIDDAFGVLELTLHTDGYDWRFIEADANATVADSGSAACH